MCDRKVLTAWRLLQLLMPIKLKNSPNLRPATDNDGFMDEDAKDAKYALSLFLFYSEFPILAAVFCCG